MAGGFAGWLAGVTGAEVLVLGSIAGYGLRRLVKSQEQTQKQLRDLATYIAVDKVIGPRVQTQLDDLGDVAMENTRKIDVLNDWRLSHDRWHERHDVRTG